MRSIRVLFVSLALLIALSACGDTGTTTTGGSTPTSQPPTVPTATPTPKPTIEPTQKLAPIPSASELSQLFSAKDGKVTDVNVTPNATGTGVALDIQVYNPTQPKVKHINYLLMQFFFGSRNDVSLLNFAFHADGYTGGDDPIANCAGVASEYKLGFGENQLWDAMGGVFNANVSA